MLNVILLSAGQGLRMGHPNKLMLPFRGSSVLETTLSELCAAAIGPLYVVTGHLRESVAPLLASFPVTEVFNPAYKTGMTGSIQAGVRSAPLGNGYMICLADMPLITREVYQNLAETFEKCLILNDRAILMPRFNDARGNPVVFAPWYREQILSHTSPEGCKGIVQAHRGHCYWANMPDNSVLYDLDTPEDYEKFT